MRSNHSTPILMVAPARMDIMTASRGQWMSRNERAHCSTVRAYVAHHMARGLGDRIGLKANVATAKQDWLKQPRLAQRRLARKLHPRNA